MKTHFLFVLAALAGCTGLSGMVSSYDSQEYASKQDFISALVSMSEDTSFAVSGFDRGTFYSDCGTYLDDYGGEYTYGKPCKVYGQTDMYRYIYIFEFGSATSMEEFSAFLSSITKFSPEVSLSRITDYPVIVFDNRLRLSYSFMCEPGIVVMVSQDMSNQNQDESELRSLAYSILDYCGRYEIV